MLADRSRFEDRVAAGRQLATQLRSLADQDPLVLGLPRGGVPVAAEVADELAAELDVIVVRKLGVPFQPELGFGAIGEDGVRIINDWVVEAAGLDAAEMIAVEQRERAELIRRTEHYRSGRARISMRGRTVIIVDDGIATGSTALVACDIARAAGARRVVLAVPVGPEHTLERFATRVDQLVTIASPADFGAVGQFYDDFAATSDDEVIELLDRAAQRVRTAGHRSSSPQVEGVTIDVEGATLPGDLTMPAAMVGFVLFAHGSGSSRHSPRNRLVASALHDAGIGTLLFDLLTPTEELDRSNVFDIVTLGRRLVEATRWVRRRPDFATTPIGYFGASTGAGAALWAASELGSEIRAVVSRGGRPDLASDRLEGVTAPTLLIVGGKDTTVLDLNKQAMWRLGGPNRLELVPGATHLFSEPGALEAVAASGSAWFLTHLPGDQRPTVQNRTISKPTS